MPMKPLKGCFHLVRPVVDFWLMENTYLCWKILNFPSRIDSDRLGYLIIISELLVFYYSKCQTITV